MILTTRTSFTLRWRAAPSKGALALGVRPSRLAPLALQAKGLENPPC